MLSRKSVDLILVKGDLRREASREAEGRRGQGRRGRGEQERGGKCEEREGE